MPTRFTITDLRNIIELCNQRLKEHGCLVRIEEFNRNGAYGTEHFPIDNEGNRTHSGSSHIASGSARSVARKTEDWSYQQINKQKKVIQSNKLNFIAVFGSDKNWFATVLPLKCQHGSDIKECWEDADYLGPLDTPEEALKAGKDWLER